MGNIHFVLVNKGGCGKSTLSKDLVQYFLYKEKECVVYDLDAANHTLAGFKELSAKVIDIMNGDDIDPRTFDGLMEDLLVLPEDHYAVIDNGASSFIALCSYLRENQALELLIEQGHQVFIHSIIVGGSSLQDTIDGTKIIMANFPTVPIILWLNPYFGKIETEDKKFFDFNFYQEHGDKFTLL